jgi:transcriptional regulator GlxA family with amidase domain
MALLRIGVMCEDVQLSDFACIDILGSLTPFMVNASSALDQDPKVKELLLSQSHEVTFYYISSSLEPASMTPSIKFSPTTTYDHCPRDLDILIIGGPLPTHRPPEADKFMQEAVPRTKYVLTTCTGSLWLAHSGVLKGKKATTNRVALDLAKKIHPEVEWVEQRWVMDGKFWTAGGAYAGETLPFLVISSKVDVADKGKVRIWSLFSLRSTTARRLLRLLLSHWISILVREDSFTRIGGERKGCWVL